MEPKKLSDPNFQYIKASDIYSYGVLMWEISSGIPPFENSTSRVDQLSISIINGFRETTTEGTPKNYEDLYSNCWDPEPERRPTIRKVLKEFENMGFGIDIKDNSTEGIYLYGHINILFI